MVIIYFDSTLKNRQVINPSSKFDGNYRKLVMHVTNSDDDRKNFYTYKILSRNLSLSIEFGLKIVNI